MMMELVEVEEILCLFLAVVRDVLHFLSQIVLAFGNYMNSSKRGAVYGFKLQSLDMVSERVQAICWLS